MECIIYYFFHYFCLSYLKQLHIMFLLVITVCFKTKALILLLDKRYVRVPTSKFIFVIALLFFINIVSKFIKT